MVVAIVKYPDLILRRKALAVEKISEEIFKLVDNMVETMLKNDGLGLAANQMGFLNRVFILNSTPREDTPKPIALVNPEIIGRQGQVVEEEGCLSFPELYLKITRSEMIRVQAKNLYNESFVLDATGLLARAIQHEIDHLNGVLIIDHVAEAEKEKVKEYLDGVIHIS